MRVFKAEEMGEDDWCFVGEALAQGGLACLPTDTVYGLACLPSAPGAVEAVYAAKERERGKPLTMFYYDLGQVREFLPGLDRPLAEKLAALLPGPATVVLPDGGENRSGRGAPAAVEAESIGVRVAPPELAELYRHLPLPLALTSANLAGSPEPSSLAEVDERILSCCRFVIDAGPCRYGRPSTVVDLRPVARGRRPLVLREGAIPRSKVEEAVGECE
jgi:L-threonylcarbamoyladenylate synthase